MDAEDFECEGHESLAGEHMGESVYCDGTCRMTRVEYVNFKAYKHDTPAPQMTATEWLADWRLAESDRDAWIAKHAV